MTPESEEIRTADDTQALHVALEREGWSVGETAFTDGKGKATWIVTGTNGGRRFRAEGPTRHEAWREARNLVAMGGDGFAAP
jgi:hypothetical protein